MAIKAIKSIPDKMQCVSQRDIIRNDIKEAIDNNIPQFEFVDDRYNYTTLMSNAKETMKFWLKREIYYPASIKAKERLKSNGMSFCTPSFLDYDKKLFALISKKLEDRIHIYCSLNLDMINNMEQIIYEDTLKMYAE